MTKAEQRRFLRGLIANVKQDVLSKVDRMPADWDGHELRAYTALRFQESAMTVGSQRADYRQRTRKFNNDVITQGL